LDFSFAPGSTPQDRRARRMFSRRPDTTLISANGQRNTLRQFIRHVATSGSITRPVDDHLIASHANSQGFLFISLFQGQNGATRYETIQTSISDSSKSIEIDDATIGYNAGDPITKAFHIKGCNIGRATPFLHKLKEALGDHVNVTAPKHFHYLFWLSRLGIFEGLSYEFNINRATPFATRADVLSAFQSGGFSRYEGSAVPNNDWNGWLPRRLSSNELRRRTRKSRAIRVTLGTSIGQTNTLQADIGFRVTPNRFTYTIAYPDAESVPDDTAGRESALNNTLNNDDTFDSSHDYPTYERWGYSSLADFIAGYTWTFAQNKNKLICRGRRYEYTVLPPIVDVGTGHFIFNFYPNSGSSHSPITNLQVTDSQFFETV